MNVTTSQPATSELDDVGADLVLTQAEASKLARLSERTWQRLDELGVTPPRIQLSGRRVGYWRRDVIAWLEARTAPKKYAA